MIKYNFKLKSDDKNLLKKNSFFLNFDKKVDDVEELFQEAVWLLEETHWNYFSLGCDDDYGSFEIIHGKNKILCEYEYDFCQHCGGHLEIWIKD